MSSILSLNSQSVILATAMVVSSTVLFLAFSKHKTSRNQESQSPVQNLRSCLCSGTWLFFDFNFLGFFLFCRDLLLLFVVCRGEEKGQQEEEEEEEKSEICRECEGYERERRRIQKGEEEGEFNYKK